MSSRFPKLSLKLANLRMHRIFILYAYSISCIFPCPSHQSCAQGESFKHSEALAIRLMTRSLALPELLSGNYRCILIYAYVDFCPVLPFHRRLSDAYYASDGASVRPSVCANGSLPSPRAVSNALFSVAHSLNGRQVNDLHTAFGLLISADLSSSRNFNASVPVTPLLIPPNDPVFAYAHLAVSVPQRIKVSSLTAIVLLLFLCCRPGYSIPFRRAQPIAGTGTSASNPLLHLNRATSWLDLEPIFGQSDERGPVCVLLIVD